MGPLHIGNAPVYPLSLHDLERMPVHLFSPLQASLLQRRRSRSRTSKKIRACSCACRRPAKSTPVFFTGGNCLTSASMPFIGSWCRGGSSAAFFRGRAGPGAPPAGARIIASIDSGREHSIISVKRSGGIRQGASLFAKRRIPFRKGAAAKGCSP